MHDTFMMSAFSSRTCARSAIHSSRSANLRTTEGSVSVKFSAVSFGFGLGEKRRDGGAGTKRNPKHRA
jgi:hypothetical protein